MGIQTKSANLQSFLFYLQRDAQLQGNKSPCTSFFFFLTTLSNISLNYSIFLLDLPFQQDRTYPSKKPNSTKNRSNYGRIFKNLSQFSLLSFLVGNVPKRQAICYNSSSLFLSDPNLPNFLHYLFFLRHGQTWKPPTEIWSSFFFFQQPHANNLNIEATIHVVFQPNRLAVAFFYILI